MKKCFVDSRISPKEFEKLSKENITIFKVPSSTKLYSAISSHPDIQINILNKNKIIVHKEFYLNCSENLSDVEIIFTDSTLESTYPNNIFLNAVNLKEFFIHNLKFTDKKLLDQVNDKTLINVKQGYTKCSCAIVNNNAIITSDVGIYNALKKYPIDVLGIPSGDILLPDMNYGFIGGCCGLISKDTLAFFGNIKHHSYGSDIEKFLIKHDVKPLYLSEEKLIDRGSILTLF